MNHDRTAQASSHAWLALSSLGAGDAPHVGRKAASLAHAAARGIPVVPGWVLPLPLAAELVAPADAGTRGAHETPQAIALAHARALLQLAPAVERWILRSSSPLEDRAGASAAGLLRSESAAAVPESIAAALVAVAGSGQAPEIRALLRTDESVPVAVLAQPLRELTAWWTLELHPAEGAALLDGWRVRLGNAEPVAVQLPWPATPPLPGQGFPTAGRAASSDGASRNFPASPGLFALGAAVIEGFGAGAWQLEVGECAGEVVLLQVRPAPARWAPLPESSVASDRPARELRASRSDEPIASLDRAAARRGDVPRFPLHDGDERDRWRWDAEHCPTPLCPLLAGWFARWLDGLPPSHPSRLIAGRWHDRIEASHPDTPSGIERAEVPPWPAPAQVVAAADAWERVGLPRSRSALDPLAERAAAVERSTSIWPDFMRQWLDFQRVYFDAPEAAAALRWARRVAAALGRLSPPVPLPPLPDHEGARRERELQALARRLAGTLATPDPVFGAHELAQVLADPHDDAVREFRDEVETHRHRYGHVAVIPWDGRGACLEEDPLPLLRELVHRLPRARASAGAAPPTKPAAVPPAEAAAELPAEPPATGLREGPARGDDFQARLVRAVSGPAARAEVETAARLAARLLARAEDDDALLARAYALFRRAARGVARGVAAEAGMAAAERDVFDVLPADLEALVQRPQAEAWLRAVRRGRALAALWDAHSPHPGEAARGTHLPGVPGDQRRGLAAGPGRGAGPPRRLEAAQQDGGPLPGEVLVVRTLLPHDAVVLGRVAAVVTESGAPLGHAAVLAREYGVPAVVAVPGALRWLAAAERVLVDGDRGTVTILAAVGSVASGA